MNTFQFTLVLLGMGVFMAVLAFGTIYGIAFMLGIGGEFVDSRITFAFFLLSCLVVYGLSFGVFTGVQKDSCEGEVRNWKQIALNAAIPLAFQTVIMTFVVFIPWFQKIVGDLLPPDTPVFGKQAAAFAYYSFWATMLGGALGGTFSGSCKKAELSAADILKMPPMPEGLSALPVEDVGQVQFNLPPE